MNLLTLGRHDGEKLQVNFATNYLIMTKRGSTPKAYPE